MERCLERGPRTGGRGSTKVRRGETREKFGLFRFHVRGPVVESLGPQNNLYVKGLGRGLDDLVFRRRPWVGRSPEPPNEYKLLKTRLSFVILTS